LKAEQYKNFQEQTRLSNDVQTLKVALQQTEAQSTQFESLLKKLSEKVPDTPQKRGRSEEDEDIKKKYERLVDNLEANVEDWTAKSKLEKMMEDFYRTSLRKINEEKEMRKAAEASLASELKNQSVLLETVATLQSQLRARESSQ
jgi:hypothetical protein